MYTLAFSSISSEAPFTSAVERSIGVVTVCVLVAVVCVSAPTFIYIYIKKENWKYELLCRVFLVPFATVIFCFIVDKFVHGDFEPKDHN